MTGFVDWLFASPPSQPSVWRVVLWWEARRIAFNAFIVLFGLGCLVGLFWAFTTRGQLQAG